MVDIGEIWATALHGVLTALVSGWGFAEDRFTNSAGKAGNIVYANLFLDALKLQPCNPTSAFFSFFKCPLHTELTCAIVPQAREAWIQADENRYGGEHKCALWKAFADRGLGVGADNHVDSLKIPSGC